MDGLLSYDKTYRRISLNLFLDIGLVLDVNLPEFCNG
jgi:hypothetical protein